MNRPTTICLTPVRNESWLLERFLKSTSLWADHIIIADQMSDDGSREIALCFPKVTVIDNQSPTYDESARQGLLLNAARQIPGPRLLIALDADEILNSNFANSPEWNTLLKACEGTVALVQRAALLPGLQSYWLEGQGHWFPLAFMDDGSEHVSSTIHAPRLPTSTRVPKLHLYDIRVLHYQFTDWERMQSKHRWYQCWERLNRPWRRPVDIYRQYHHMDAVARDETLAVPKEWLCGYEQEGIDMTSVYREPVFRWDCEVLALFAEYGPAIFKREAIWDVNWTNISKTVGCDAPEQAVRDPRSLIDKLVHLYLRRTQPFASKSHIRLVDECLKFAKW